MHARVSFPIGPILFLDHVAEGQLHLSALFIAEGAAPLPPVELGKAVIPPVLLARYDRHSVASRFRRIGPRTTAGTARPIRSRAI
jgi:hypothetical protein